MSDLTTSHIEQISRYVKKQNISYSYLAEELTDHICCEVEEKMQQGLDFSDAYRTVISQIPPARIREIQEETLFVIDTKYRFMKTLLKISGVTGTILLIFGAMLKIQHLPGAGILMSSGAIILAFLFLPASLSVLWKETHSKKSLLLFVSAFAAGVLFIFGTLFKIQHWPGAGFVLSLAAASFIFLFIPALLAGKIKEQDSIPKKWIFSIAAAGAVCYSAALVFRIQNLPFAGALNLAGILLICLIAFPWYAWITWRHESKVDSRFTFAVITIFLILIPGTLLNLNTRRRFDDGFTAALNRQQYLFNCQYNENQLRLNQYSRSGKYPEIKLLFSETDKLLGIVGSIQAEMLSGDNERRSVNVAVNVGKSGSGSENDNMFPLYDNRLSTKSAKHFLYPGTSSRREMELAISAYLSSISGYVSEVTASKYKDLLSPEVYLPVDTTDRHFISKFSGLHSLGLLKNSIMAVESDVMTKLAAK